jgi:hypothetical protein
LKFAHQNKANDQIVEAPNIPEGKVPIKKKDGEM